MRVYKELSPLDKLPKAEAKASEQYLGMILLALVSVVIFYITQ